MKFKKLAAFLSCIVIVALVNSPVTAGELPKILVVATYGTAASSEYMVESAMAPETEKITGMKIRISGSDTRLAQYIMIREKEAHYLKTHWGTGWRPIFGAEEFGVKNWGPQKVMLLWKGGPYYTSVAVKGDSDIKKISDLKGKKISYYFGSQTFWEALLHYGGLKLNDVKKVNAASYTKAIKLLTENKVDAAFAFPSSGASYELASSAGGGRWLELALKGNEKTWSEVTSICPAFMPGQVPQGYGAELSSGIWMPEIPEAEFAYPHLSEEIAYAITKARVEGWEKYKAAYKTLKYWTVDAALDCFKIPSPYHPGSVRYFKEKGLWTGKHEKWQKRAEAHQELLAQAWKKATAEADKKGMKISVKNQEWQDFWKTYWQPLALKWSQPTD